MSSPLQGAHGNHEGWQPPPSPSLPSLLSVLSTPAESLPRLLPLDSSRYADVKVPESALSQHDTSLSELAHLVRSEHVHLQKRSQSRIRLHRWQVSSSLSARFLNCGRLGHKSLMECFQSGDKKTFATLHAALHGIRSSYDAMRRYALLEPDLQVGKAKVSPDAVWSSDSFSTFMHEIPPVIRDEILAFVSEVRMNPDFLAARIADMTPAELMALTSFRPVMEPQDLIVMPSGKPLVVKRTPTASNTSPVKRLLSFQRHDPLSALVYTIFAPSSGPDSPEDLRRLDVWATACARLVADGKVGGEKFLRNILDVWADMREWSVKRKLEVYLMQTLQEGQFLLEKLEGRSGKSGAAAEKTPTKPLEYRTEEFFDRAIKSLFRIIHDDDAGCGGVPPGVMDIGRAILKKINNLDDDRDKIKKWRSNTENTIVFRWFFSTFLPHALVYPESQGIMVRYHISNIAREKILKEIATRTQQQVLGVWNNTRYSVVVMPEVKHHVKAILDKLSRPRLQARPVLLPAKAVTSPKETVEVQPFLVMCPADIATLVHALFPERKVRGKDIPGSGLASAASSISHFSMPGDLSSTPRDGSSILSQSVSSMTSDATSREPLLAAETSDATEGESGVQPTEEYGRKLRRTCSDMSRLLGADTVSGSCHPYADRWAVLHISRDGRELLTKSRSQMDDDDGDDESCDSDSEDEDGPSGAFQTEYQQLKHAVSKLLSEYEVPPMLSDPNAFSDGRNPHKKRRRRFGPPMQRGSPAPRNPPSTQQPRLSDPIPGAVGSQYLDQTVEEKSKEVQTASTEVPTPPLLIMLEAAYFQTLAGSKWGESQLWHRTLQQLGNISPPALALNGYTPLLNVLGRGPRDSLRRAHRAMDEFSAWFIWLDQSQERQDCQLEEIMLAFQLLRDKMWYSTAVLTSAVYDDLKNVAIALDVMGKKPKAAEPKLPLHKRAFSKTGAANFLVKTETQVLDILAAPLDYGGPSKLADAEVEAVVKWLKQNHVEHDFCKSEERIHRFCMEIDKCANKIVGDSVIDAPVLWSSELFQRDRNILDQGHPEFWLTGAGLCFSDEDHDGRSRKPVSMSLDFVRRPAKSSAGSASVETPQQNLDSEAKPVHLMDVPDYFLSTNPASTIDSTVTFWSPFQTQSPTQNPPLVGQRQPVKGTKPGVLDQVPSAALKDEKRRFLGELRRTLVGLLLSDLGSLVFNNGSETDVWFAGEVVDECLRIKEEQERRRRHKLARRKSTKALKQLRDPRITAVPSTTVGRSSPTAAGQTTDDPSSPVTDVNPRSLPPITRAAQIEFPFRLIFRLLLQEFSIHPNPYDKLEALYKLRQLIERMLTDRPGRGPPRRESPKIAESASRGSPVSQGRETPTTPSGRGSPMTGKVTFGNSSPSSDMAIEVLEGLFRDPKTRPRSLFRDLQYIAAFIPRDTLEKSVYGKAFCDASVAAVGLKQDIVQGMVLIADDIVAENTQNRPLSIAAAAQQRKQGQPVAAQQGPTPPQQPASPVRRRFKMADAATMYLIAAKEGHPVAQRELAIFYLTQEETPAVASMPLVRPRDVFKGEMLARNRRAVDSGTSIDDARGGDPLMMCLARHWMEMGSLGGDEVATKHIQERDELERLPSA